MTANKTNTDNMNNVQDIASIGRKAVTLWKSGDKGDALAIYALSQAWFTMTFNAKVTNGKTGVVEDECSFDLEEYCNVTPMNENHTKNTKLMNARTHAVIFKLFGIETKDVTPAHKQRIQRAVSAVQNLVRLGYTETDITLSRRNNLCVPYQVMHDEPDEKATDNQRKLYNAMCGESHEIDSTKGNSLAELSRRVAPVIKREAATGNGEKGSSFIASIKLVNSVMQRLMDENAPEDMPAPDDTMRAEMFSLQATLAKYFAADPMEEKKSDPMGKKRGLAA